MNIPYEQSGQGQPLVFIHGSYASTSTWKPMIAALKPHFQCINVKLPGHCGLPAPDDMQSPSIESEFEHLRQAVTALGDQPFHLIGHSYGGVVALAAALSDQFNIARLSLFEPVALWIFKTLQDDAALAQITAFQHQYEAAIKRDDPDSPGILINFWSGAGAFQTLPEALQAQMRDLILQNMRHWAIIEQSQVSTQRLQKLTIPVDLVYGTETNPLMHKVVECLQHWLPNANTSKIEGANHFLVTSHAQPCLQAIQLTHAS